MRYLIFVAAFLLASITSAQANCAPSSATLKMLSEKYKESIVFSGVTHLGNQYLVTLSESGSWSVVVLMNKGGREIACLMATGRDGISIAPVEEPGEPI